MLSQVQFFVTPWTLAHQAPQSMEFFGQKYWSGLLFAIQGNLPNCVIEPTSLAYLELADGFFITASPREDLFIFFFLKPDTCFSIWIKSNQSEVNFCKFQWTKQVTLCIHAFSLIIIYTYDPFLYLKPTYGRYTEFHPLLFTHEHSHCIFACLPHPHCLFLYWLFSSAHKMSLISPSLKITTKENFLRLHIVNQLLVICTHRKETSSNVKSVFVEFYFAPRITLIVWGLTDINRMFIS